MDLVHAGKVRDAAGLARALRELRQREARVRRGPELTYRQIAVRTGWSVSAVGAYFSGARVPRPARLRELLDLLGATEAERAALTAARARLGSGGRSGGRAGRRPARAVVAAGPDRGGPEGFLSRGSPPEVPRTLPAPVRGFVGRAAELALLDRLLARRGRAPGSGTAVVTGMGGVGKTTLVTHWAHRATPAFRHGQLYVDLYGYSACPPRTPADALKVLLTALGVADADLPDSVGERIEMYQGLLRGRSVLVLLDNAVSADQVRPLLPPPSCVVVVTGRHRRLTVDLDAAVRVALDPLPESDSVALLHLLIGKRASQEPEAARALARRCGHLPLALRVLAEQAVRREQISLAELVAELGDGRAGLRPFEVPGDERADVRTVLSWSLRWVPDASAHLFRLLGLLPGSDIDRSGLAALAGVAPGWVDELIAPLREGHLIRPEPVERFSLHDLVIAYAREVCASQLTADDRQAAAERWTAASQESPAAPAVRQSTVGY